MTPERWQQIDQLFHEALAREPARRSDFLASACAGDEPLRREIESLLSFHDEDQSFIERPAADIAAEMLGCHKSRFEPGQQINKYRILRRLGSGGMGEVYLAEDTNLNRKIALKLLPPEFTINADRVRRFRLEARAASALNHPNIITIHEIGHSNSTHFIATEFVDGVTLREKLAGAETTLAEVLDVGVQIASALTAAHEAGIIHRDVKPDNVMVRADGYVKVLDFGLAKLIELPTQEVESETRTLVNSNPGMVLGTVQYMSPEQARGQNVDARSDIWSLGVMLYEMVSGHVPFAGETASHVIVSVLDNEVPPLSRNSEVPAEFERIVARALNKNRDHRYQKVSDLAFDLKSLKEELGNEARLQRSLRPEPQIKEAPMAKPARFGIEPAATAPILSSRSTSSAEYLARRIIKSRKVWALILTGLIVTVGLVVGLSKLAGRRSSTFPLPPFKTIELVRLTNTGRVTDAAISLDGVYVGYVTESEGKESIWLRRLNTPNKVEIVAPAEREFYGLTFSRDNHYLYYTAKERNNTMGALHRVPMQGGPSVQLIHDVDGPIALSPDGKQLAFTRGSSSGDRALILANTYGGEERKLSSRTGYQAFSFSGPAWSPDGKSIVCGAGYTDVNGRYLSVVSVDVADGSLKPLNSQRWKAMGRIAWLEDGRGIVFAATSPGSGTTSQLWYLSYPNGEAQRITTDLQDYHEVSLSGDATTLVSNQTQTISSMWVAPNNDSDRAKQILSHKEDDAYDAAYYFRTRFSWIPGDQIIYTSLVNGKSSIWIMTAQGTGNLQLSGGGGDKGFPSMTADGRYVVFTSDRGGFLNVWRMDRDGNNEVQLTKGEDESWAWCSPDSHWIVYHSSHQGKRTLWRVSVEGGNPEQLTDYPSTSPVVSPDGKWISCYYRRATKAPWQLAIIPFDGGPPVKTFEIPPNVVFQTLLRWTPDGQSLAYIIDRDGISNIWTQPVDGGAAKQLTDFKSDQIFWFDWSPDGRQLGVSRGSVTSDVVLIRDLVSYSSRPAR